MIYAVSVAAAILFFCILTLIFSKKAENYETIKRRVYGIDKSAKKRYRATDEELSRPLSERFFKPALASISNFFSRFLPIIFRRRNKNTESQKMQQLRNQLSMAGMAMEAEEFSAIRFLVICGCGFISSIMAVMLHTELFNRILLILCGFFVSYAAFRFYLSMKVTKRKNAIERQLPDVLDLLSVSVEAGLGFEQALTHISNNMEGPLIDEIIVTAREMSLGRTRKDALNLLGERCNIDDLRSFAAALIQAGQLGIPMKNVLRSQSAAIRVSRKAKVQERAMKVSTKMLIPMVVFIFPVIFIVLMGPAIINMIGDL
ncbi:MAG: type II secretion system F family protein [Lachnospiraceae bacterium]|nr:type II secretion system F family protein [Lachnospiraceae bacterium]